MGRVLDLASSADEYRLQFSSVTPATIPENVSARKGNKAAWPALTGISIAQVEIPVGTWRAPHYHTNTPEIAVIVQGSARAGLWTPANEHHEVDLAEGDCVFFPLGWPHWLRNTGSTPLKTYFNYGNEQPVTFEIGNLVVSLSGNDRDAIMKGFKGYAETE